MRDSLLKAGGKIRQVVSTALAMVTAVLIVTAKPCEIVHCFPSTCTAYLGNRLLSVAKICQ